ncbi:hypothetical protein GCK32_018041 [Trichostrongylus colubriformis]|uniref:Uncharacterized protein n=1 Tax=Trichostrongylus colubriformis TaxID=6319 RepID=A0AAN8IE35_TRICO
MKVHFKRRPICYLFISIVLTVYCFILLKRTLTFLYGTRTRLLTETEFFGLINSTYGNRRVLERIELPDGSTMTVCDVIKIKHERFYVFRQAEVPVGTVTTLLLQTPEGKHVEEHC